MDKAPDFGSGDCRFESLEVRNQKTGFKYVYISDFTYKVFLVIFTRFRDFFIRNYCNGD